MGLPVADGAALGDLLKFAEIISIIGTGMVVVFKIGQALARFEMIGAQQAKEIGELKDTIKEIAQAQTASISDRATIASLSVQLSEMRQEINLMKRGQGFVARDINGEWPRAS